MISKLKKLTAKANRKFTELVADELEADDTAEFDIDVDETFEEPEEVGTKLGKMDEAISEIQEHLTEQKEELYMLKAGLMKLDVRRLRLICCGQSSLNTTLK